MEFDALINYTICPNGPVLVSASSGNKLHPEMPDRTFLKSCDNGVEKYVIPGSSLKGVIRHYLYKKQSDDLVDSLFGYSNKNKKENRKSRVSIYDAFADMDTIETTVRYSTAIGSVSQSAKRGSLNQCEAVIKGSFNGTMRLHSVSEVEIAMILSALNAMNSGEICVGGRISRGFGRISVNQFEMIVTRGYNADLTPNIIGRYISIDEALAKTTNQ
ncbi:MAG: hypothetical protein K2J47_02960 [Ruminococcus sp.]|nr:hypothetical protein [Ruminococcus sp.]